MSQGELKLLTVPELATILRIGMGGIRAMIQRGELPAFKLGGRWFVRERALILTLENMEADARPLDDDDLRALAYDVPTDIPPDPEEPPLEPLDIPEDKS